MLFCGNRPKADQSTMPEQSTNADEKGFDDKNLAPDDIFTARKKLGQFDSTRIKIQQICIYEIFHGLNCRLMS